MKVNIGGDLVINSGLKVEIDSQLKSLFSQGNFNIVNLEAPVTNHPVEALKTGPSLRCHEKPLMFALDDLMIRHVTIANNHLGDYGLKGIKDTLTFLKKNQLNYVGGYVDEQDFERPMFLTEDGITVGVINIAENEWSNLLSKEFGANHLDIISNVNQIKEVKKLCDHLILIYHGGNEHHPYPAPQMKRLFHFFVDQGVDFIVAHHSHCISGYEEYKGKHIYYGLGNFLFTKVFSNNTPKWFEGMFVTLDIDKSKVNVKHNFVRFDPMKRFLCLVSSEDRNKLEHEVVAISEVIKSDRRLSEEFEKFIVTKSGLYENYLLRSNSILNDKVLSLLKRLKIIRYKPTNYKVLYNLLRCESHKNMLTYKLFKDLYAGEPHVTHES